MTICTKFPAQCLEFGVDYVDNDLGGGVMTVDECLVSGIRCFSFILHYLLLGLVQCRSGLCCGSDGNRGQWNGLLQEKRPGEFQICRPWVYF